MTEQQLRSTQKSKGTLYTRITALLTRKSSTLSDQVLRYLLSSAASLCLDFSLLWFLTEVAGLHYLISAPIAYTGGLLLNYYASAHWVFSKRKIQSRATEFLVFVVIGLIGMGINEAILWTWVDLLGLYYLTGRAASAVFGYIWKFFARKAILFS